MAQITEYLEILLAGVDLTFKQSTDLLDNIFEGSVSETQIAAFLTAMRAKEPAPAEIAGLATSLLNHAVAVNPGIDNMIDTCGTGGAKLKTFNIPIINILVSSPVHPTKWARGIKRQTCTALALISWKSRS